MSADSDGPTDSDGHTISWRELLSEAEQRLVSTGAENSGVDARRIVEAASGATGHELFLLLDDPVTERAVAHFDTMVSRRLSGEPLQYVIGSWSFRNLDLMVDPRVLIPRPETEHVVEVALEELDVLGAHDRQVTVVDLGTGSGAIGLSIAAERVRSEVWLTDRSDDALDVARSNIAGLGRAGARVSAVSGSWWEALPDHLRGSVDLVVSNPPYIPNDAELPAEVQDWEPSIALRSGVDGLDDIRSIIPAAGEWLCDHGVFICELSPEQSTQVLELARRYFHEARIESDLTGRHRMVVATRPS